MHHVGNHHTEPLYSLAGTPLPVVWCRVCRRAVETKDGRAARLLRTGPCRPPCWPATGRTLVAFAGEPQARPRTETLRRWETRGWVARLDGSTWRTAVLTLAGLEMVKSFGAWERSNDAPTGPAAPGSRKRRHDHGHYFSLALDWSRRRRASGIAGRAAGAASR